MISSSHPGMSAYGHLQSEVDINPDRGDWWPSEALCEPIGQRGLRRRKGALALPLLLGVNLALFNG